MQLELFKNNMRSYTLLFPFLVVITMLTGCLSYKDIVNFQDGHDLNEEKFEQIRNAYTIQIQPGDILQITVHSSNQIEAQRFNIMTVQEVTQAIRIGAGNNLSEPLGYIVDREGYIDMPVIGKVDVLNRSIEEAKELIEDKIADTGYLRDQNIQIRFLSFRITVSGEVNYPGSYIIQSQRINILEALGLAGDVTIFSNRDNILIIREKNGIRSFGRLNIKSKDIFDSPYFYLQPNDVIYVEPHRAKVMAAPDPASRYMSIVTGTLTIITLILALK